MKRILLSTLLLLTLQGCTTPTGSTPIEGQGELDSQEVGEKVAEGGTGLSYDNEGELDVSKQPTLSNGKLESNKKEFILYGEENHFDYVQSFTLNSMYELYESGIIEISPNEQLYQDSVTIGVSLDEYKAILEDVYLLGEVYKGDNFAIYFDYDKQSYNISGRTLKR